MHHLMLSMATATVALLTVTASFGAYAASDEFAQRGAHVHGNLTVNIALDSGQLTIGIDAPAINVVGFERAPRSSAERQSVADVESWLRSGRNLVGVPRAAGCTLGNVELQSPDWTATADRDGHSHADHDDEHENADAEGHADYEVRVRYDCRDIAALAFVDLWLLQRLPNVQQADVNIVSASLQTATTATPASTRIELR